MILTGAKREIIGGHFSRWRFRQLQQPPSPTTATAFVTQTVTVKLLVVIPSLKPRLEVLLATVHATAQRNLIEVKYSVVRTTGFILLY